MTPEKLLHSFERRHSAALRRVRATKTQDPPPLVEPLETVIGMSIDSRQIYGNVAGNHGFLP